MLEKYLFEVEWKLGIWANCELFASGLIMVQINNGNRL